MQQLLRLALLGPGQQLPWLQTRVGILTMWPLLRGDARQAG